MDKSLRCLISLLPFVFLIHNIEEAYVIYTSEAATASLYTSNSLQFLAAVLLFSIFGFIATYWKSLYSSIKRYEAVVIGFSGMLFLNVFFPHILSAVYLWSYTPGLFSAIILVLPLTSCILWKVYKSKSLSTKKLLITVTLGGVVGLVLVFLFLGVGYIVTSI